MYSPWGAWWANLTWPWLLAIVVIGGFVAAIIALIIVATVTEERQS